MVAQTPPRSWSDLAVGRRAAVLGDSNATDTYAGISFFKYAALLGGGTVMPKVQAGVAGNTTAQMEARLPSDVPGQGVDCCVILGGTNDTPNGIDPALSLATLRRMARRCRGQRVQPVFCTVPPYSFTGDPFYAQRLANYATLNRLLADAAAADGVPL